MENKLVEILTYCKYKFVDLTSNDLIEALKVFSELKPSQEMNTNTNGVTQYSHLQAL